MLSSEFSKIFHLFPNIECEYLGHFSADTIPLKLKVNQFAIINTDTSFGKGKHWYCFLKYSSSSLEVFDSLGVNKQKKEFLSQNLRLSGIKDLEINTTQFQRDDTDSCGKYVIYFLINRLYNLDHSYKCKQRLIMIDKFRYNNVTKRNNFAVVAGGGSTDFIVR